MIRLYFFPAVSNGERVENLSEVVEGTFMRMRDFLLSRNTTGPKGHESSCKILENMECICETWTGLTVYRVKLGRRIKKNKCVKNYKDEKSVKLRYCVW
jgi:hypothetical protein